jgi:hypothetical protein
MSSELNTTTIPTSTTPPSGLYGIVSMLFGFMISIAEYVIFYIIQEFSSLLGIQTEGKDLNYILDAFNKALDDPITREKFKILLGSLGEMLIIFLEEMKDPFKTIIYEFIDVGSDAADKIVKKLVGILLNAIGIIPGAGEILEAIRTVDDVVIQVQSLIRMFIQFSSVFIKFFGNSFTSVLNIKNRVEKVTNKIHDQLKKINALTTLPSSTTEIKNQLNEKIKNISSSIPSAQNILKSATDSASSAILTAATGATGATADLQLPSVPTTEPSSSLSTNSEAVSVGGGGFINVKKNILTISNRIRKTIKTFLNNNEKNEKKNEKYKKTKTRKQRKYLKH